MKKIIFITSILTSIFCNSQTRTAEHIIISGTVYGYNFDPSVKLINNDKSEIEGSLGGVSLTAFDGTTKLASAKSSNNGTFQFVVPVNKLIKIEYAKEGYVTSSFNINLANVPADIQASGLVFENIEIALNHFVSAKTEDTRPFGNVFYNTSTRALDFEEIVYKDKKKLFGDNQDITPVNLMKKSVKKNLSNNAEPIIVVQENIVSNNEVNSQKPNNQNKSDETDENNVIIDENGKPRQVYIMPKFDFSKMSASDILNRQSEIDQARQQLEQDKLLAITPEDFALIQAREDLLNAAEKELENAKQYIVLQEKEITAQNFKILLLLALLVVLGISLFLIVRYARQKVKLNKELDTKNRKIMESIRYALRIQQSVLLPITEFKKLLPNSFIFYKPLDVVSGDFYWISEVNNKVVLVVADCTGHGVPGAFMSLIGNTLLNHIVNEKGIYEPSKILDELHQGIIHSLRQAESDENNQDGMDVSVCLIDKTNGTVTFSGAMNPVYYIENGEFKILEPTLKAVGGIEKRKKLADLKFHSIQIKPASGTTFLMTSDGFMDQFGGSDESKYNLPQFKKTTLNLASKNSSEQLLIFEKSFNDWKGSNKQVDDVLLVGFTI